MKLHLEDLEVSVGTFRLKVVLLVLAITITGAVIATVKCLKVFICLGGEWNT